MYNAMTYSVDVTAGNITLGNIYKNYKAYP